MKANRTSALRLGIFALVLVMHSLLLTSPTSAEPPKKFPLPQSTIFTGEKRFQSILVKARGGKWHLLSMGDRMVKFGEQLEGVPYKSFTLEIHDHIESPSVNLHGLDCWTFFEITLGFARMIEGGNYARYRPADLLAQIQTTRYRNGKCSGDYLERIHYLAEWYFDNEARGIARDLSKELGGVRHRNEVKEMTLLWKSYRYLKNNPGLRPKMTRLEKQIEKFPVYMVPQHKIQGIEKHLKNGDIIGIATKHDGGFCSHVGIIDKNRDGRARFMHACSTKSKGRKVITDGTISHYIKSYDKHVGILVARPLPLASTISNDAVYKENLRRLLNRR